MAYIIIFLNHLCTQNRHRDEPITAHFLLTGKIQVCSSLQRPKVESWTGFNLRFAGKVLKETGHQGFTSRIELMILWGNTFETYAGSNYGTPLIIFLGGERLGVNKNIFNQNLKTPVDGWNLILFWSQRKQDFSNTENVTREMSSDFAWFQTSLLPLEPKLKQKLGAFAHQLFDTIFSHTNYQTLKVNLRWINQPITSRCFLDACFQYVLLMFTYLFGKIAWLVDTSQMSWNHQHTFLVVILLRGGILLHPECMKKHFTEI